MKSHKVNGLCLYFFVLCIFSQPLQSSEFDPGEELYAKTAMQGIPVIPVPPAIDGNISPKEWDVAAAITGFYGYSDGRLLDMGPVAFLAYDKTNIYILLMSPKPEGRELLAKCRTHDGPTYQDDAIEVFLHMSNNLYQIIVNSGGIRTDIQKQ